MYEKQLLVNKKRSNILLVVSDAYQYQFTLLVKTSVKLIFKIDRSKLFMFLTNQSQSIRFEFS